MSSYLTFYIQTKKGDKVSIASYSRNTDIYKAFNENLSLAYAGNNECYTELTSGNVGYVTDDLQRDINAVKDKLAIYDKYAKDDPDYIESIIGLQDYLKDLQNTLYSISFIETMVQEVELKTSDVKAVLVNII